MMSNEGKTWVSMRGLSARQRQKLVEIRDAMLYNEPPVKTDNCATIAKLELLKGRVSEFRNAYRNLQEQWSYGEVAHLGTKEYPFDMDFDNLQVVRWCITFISEIEKEIDSLSQ